MTGTLVTQNNSEALATPQTAIATSTLEKALVGGDLAALSPNERLTYYRRICESVGLNPLTRPFEYITLNNKLTLYARRDAADQLRKIHGISLKIIRRELVDNIYVVEVEAHDKYGRIDTSIGAVPLVKEGGEWTGKFFKKNGEIIPLGPDEKANAMMKAETKAKRRVSFSICGLGFLDETEVESISTAKVDNGSRVMDVRNEYNVSKEEVVDLLQNSFRVSHPDDLSVAQCDELIQMIVKLGSQPKTQPVTINPPIQVKPVTVVPESKPSAPYKNWTTPNDAIEWAKSMLPDWPTEELKLEFDKLPIGEGEKKAVKWVKWVGQTKLSQPINSAELENQDEEEGRRLSEEMY